MGGRRVQNADSHDWIGTDGHEYGRLLQGGHSVIAYNRTPGKTDQIVEEGAIGAYSFSEVIETLSPPRVIWIMLPAGPTVDDHMIQLKDILSPGDMVIDGGNTYYKDDIRRADLLAEKKIKFIDAGVSGGIWGLKKGYCLMIGGEKRPANTLSPYLRPWHPLRDISTAEQLGPVIL